MVPYIGLNRRSEPHLFENNVVKHALTHFNGTIPPAASTHACRSTTPVACATSQPLPGARAYFAKFDTAPPPLPRQKTKGMNPLRWLQIEVDLKCEMQENITHQRMMGSY
ncbi:hypothetical protein EI94DRAFT_1803726 [Lactarius quietus]|nr:hypothetical protein EI94DRAFT_1803726 [Lactarius quietus]